MIVYFPIICNYMDKLIINFIPIDYSKLIQISPYIDFL